MGKGLDIIPILYIVIPIFTGGAIGAVFNKYNILNRIYPIIAIVYIRKLHHSSFIIH